MSQKNKLLLLLLIVGGLFNVAFASSSSYGSSSSFAVINKPMAYIIQSNGVLGRVDLATGDYLYGETPVEPLINTLTFKADSKQILYAIADSIRQTEWIGVPPLENKARKQSWYTNFNGVNGAITSYSNLISFIVNVGQQSNIKEINSNDGIVTDVMIYNLPETMIFKNMVRDYYNHYVLARTDLNATKLFTLSGGYATFNTLAETYDLQGLALYSSTSKLVSWDAVSTRFVWIDPSLNTIVPLDIYAMGVTDIRVLQDSTIIWSSNTGLWKAKNGQAPIRIGAVTNVVALEIDENNIAEYFYPKRKVIPTLINGLTPIELQITNPYYNYDSYICEAEPLNAGSSTIYRQGDCKFVAWQNNVMPNIGDRDSLRIILSDRRGTLDTSLIVLEYRPSTPPTIEPLADPWNVIAGADNRLKVRVLNEVEDQPNVSIFKYLGQFNYTATGSTCTNVNEDWFAHTFRPNQNGSLARIGIEASYAVPFVMSIYYGRYQEGQIDQPMLQQIFAGRAPGPQSYELSDLIYVNSGNEYTVVFRKLDVDDHNTNAQVCLGPFQDSEFYFSMSNHEGQNNSISHSLFFVESSNIMGLYYRPSVGDTAVFDFVPGASEVSQSYTWLVRAKDQAGVDSKLLTVNVDNTVAVPLYTTGNKIRIPWRSSDADLEYYYIENWNNKESTEWPRTYVVEDVGAPEISALTFYNYLPSVSGQMLSVARKVGASGTSKFLVKRCDDVGNCSNTDTAYVTLSRPPQHTVSLPDSIQANKTQVVPITITDLDPGDLNYAKVFVHKIIKGTSQEINNGFLNTKGILQSFTSNTTGMLGAIQVHGTLVSSSVHLRIYKLPNLSTSIYMGEGGAQQIFDRVVPVAKPAEYGWNDLQVLGVQLEAGKHYAFQIGEEFSSAPDYMSMTQTTTDAIAGYAFDGYNGFYNATPNSGDLAFKTLIYGNKPNWVNQEKSGSDWVLNLNPTVIDTGSLDVAVVVDDSTGFSASISTIVVTPAPPVWAGAPALKIPAATTDSIQREYKNWIDMAALPVGAKIQIGTVNAIDNALFFDTPKVVNGSLYFIQNKNVSGTYNIWTKACLQDNVTCSDSVVSVIQVSYPPSLFINVADTLFAPTTELIPFNASDVDGDMLSVQGYALDTFAYAKTSFTQLSSNAVGQTFVAEPGLNIGAIRVFAKFPKDYVHVSINEVNGVLDGPVNSLICGDVAVTAGVLDWHEIAIPGKPALVDGKKYQIILSYPSDSWLIEYGVSNSGENALGTLIQYSANVDSETGVVSYSGMEDVAKDLQAEIFKTAPLPAWMSVNSTELSISPALLDTGKIHILLTAFDGLNTRGYTEIFYVKKPAAPTWVGGANLTLSMLMGDAQKRYVENWVDRSALPVGSIVRVGGLTLADEALFASAPIIDYNGSLIFDQKANVHGVFNVWSEACLADGVTCSAKSMSTLTIKTAPQITWNLPDSIKAPASFNEPVVVTDADGDATYVFGSLLKTFAESKSQHTLGTAHAVGQTFIASASMDLKALRFYGSFQKNYVTIFVAPVEGNALDIKNSIIQGQIPVTANVEGWHNLVLPSNVTLTANQEYHVTIGYEPGTGTVKYGIDTTGQNANGKIVMYSTTIDPETAQMVSTSVVQGKYDLQGAILVTEGSLPAWLTASSTQLSVNTTKQDTGIYTVLLEATDGMVKSGSVRRVVVFADTAKAPIWVAGSSLGFAKVIGENVQRSIKNWADVSSMPVDVYFKTGYVTLLDSQAFLGKPIIYNDGELSFMQAKEVSGSFSFWSQACVGIDMCSDRDTTTLKIGNTPSIQVVALSDTLWTNEAQKAKLIVADKDLVDMPKLKLSMWQLTPQVLSKVSHKNATAVAVGQTFKFSVPTELGGFRIKAKFPVPFVRVIVAPVINGVAAGTENTLLDMQVPVESSVYTTHQILLPNLPLIPGNMEYHISVGYEGDVNQVTYAIDTTNSAKFSLVEYLGAPNYDPKLNPKAGLEFELLLKKTGPVWAKILSGEAEFAPAFADTGKYLLSFEVTDGLYSSAVAKAFYATARKAITDTNSIDPSLLKNFVVRKQINMQALEISVLGVPDTLRTRLELQVTLRSSSKDSILNNSDAPWTFAPLIPGKYELSWFLKDTKTGKIIINAIDSFAIENPILTPPALNTWYMVGFGSEMMPLTEFLPQTSLYGWLDTNAYTEFGNYIPRSAMTNTVPGSGYWYYAEGVADTLRPAPLTERPAPFKLPLKKGLTGWNLIANPWPWPISLPKDTLVGAFWVWRAEINSYVQVTKLNPYMAAWCYVDQATSLTLNPQPNFNDEKAGLSKPSLAKSNGKDWIVQVGVKSGTSMDDWNSFGVQNGASVAVESMDDRKPPTGMGSTLKLAFVQQGVQLARALQSATDTIWNMQIEAGYDRSAELVFSGVVGATNAGKQLIVQDSKGKVIQVQEDGSYAVQLSKGNNRFVVTAMPSKMSYELNGIASFQSKLSRNAVDLEWNVSLELAGNTGFIEWTDLQGRVLFSKKLPVQNAGINSLRIPLKQSGVGVVRLRIGTKESSLRILSLQ